MGTPNRTTSVVGPSAAKDCLDCTLSRLRHHRLCQQHWQAFMFWLVDARKSIEFRRASPTERDRIVRNWAEAGSP